MRAGLVSGRYGAGPLRLDLQVRKSLVELVYYNFEDELRDFFDNPMDAGKEKSHALAHVCIVIDAFFPLKGPGIRKDILDKAKEYDKAEPEQVYTYTASANALIKYLDKVRDGYTKAEEPLPDLVSRAIKIWEEFLVSDRVCNVTWFSTKEGKAYIRYNRMMDRIDIASIEIRPKYKSQGIFKKLLAAAMAFPVKHVRIESIMNGQLATSAIAWQFEGWDSTWDGPMGEICCVTVNLTRRG